MANRLASWLPIRSMPAAIFVFGCALCSLIIGTPRAVGAVEILDNDVRLSIDLPAGPNFDSARPTLLIIYATPNGSTVEQTLGGKAPEGAAALDYRFDLQHVGAQVRRWREVDLRENIALAVVQAPQKSWPAFRKAHDDAPKLEREIVETVVKRASTPISGIILTGHSGGGSFLFGFIDSGDAIPASVRRIAFLDANYSYSDAAKHGDKLLAWLRGDPSRSLVVIAYDDREIILNGKKVVGPDGGTFRASHRMLDRFSKDMAIASGHLGPFDTFAAMNGQIRFFIHPNPENKILHTALIGEMNGLLQAMTLGTPEEQKWGTFGGPRAYTECVRTIDASAIPLRPADAVGGTALMQRVASLPRDAREEQIAAEVLRGNVPEFLRQFKTIHISAALKDGKPHTIDLRVMPDYLSVGSDADFVRVPLTPMTAKKIASDFGCVLPTRKIVDEIYRQAEVKLEPHPMTEHREAVDTFLEHNRIIEEQRKGHALGELVAGIKKDVVLTNRLAEKPGHVAIYGWHKPDGQPIQPLTTVHIATYVDYSHGIRLVDRQVLVDGKEMRIEDVLTSPELNPLISDEGPLNPSEMYR
jgi:hypothetical protein